MALTERTKSRLLNWKFEQAKSFMYADTSTDEAIPTDQERETVEALAATFGNPGWFEGSMGDIVRAAVWFLGVTDPSD